MTARPDVPDTPDLDAAAARVVARAHEIECELDEAASRPDNWLTREFARANARRATLPPFALPVQIHDESRGQ